MMTLYLLRPFLVLGGCALAICAFAKRSKHKRYEFEHRTSGGVVEFKSYEDAQAFKRSVVFWDLAKVGGMMIAFLGLVMFAGL